MFGRCCRLLVVLSVSVGGLVQARRPQENSVDDS